MHFPLEPCLKLETVLIFVLFFTIAESLLVYQAKHPPLLTARWASQFARDSCDL